jgi:hypothetical protein
MNPALERKPGQNGRPPKKGKRLPVLEKVLEDARTSWKKVVIPNWYGEGRSAVEITSSTSVWYHSGMPPLPIHWVLIRDPLGKFKSQALLYTDLNKEPEQILKCFTMRWQFEVTFHEVRDHLGIETQRQVVRLGHCPHHSSLAGPVLAGDFTGQYACPEWQDPGPASCLVLQAFADFFGYVGARATRSMATSLFSAIAKTV